ncbi:MAG: glycosyltransferase family 4 protein [Actinomycetota bacterium]
MVNASPHVLLVVENAPVPQDRRVWNQARALRDHGYDVTVLSPADPRAERRMGREQIDGIDIQRFPMPFGGPRKIDFVLEYGWALVVIHLLTLRIWLRRRFVSIHVANPPDLFFGLKWIFGRFGVRFIFDQHDLGPQTYQSKFDEPRQDLLWRALRWMEDRSYGAADVVISTNESYKRHALERTDLGDDDVFVVRNSPDLDLFRPRPPRPELKEGHAHMAVFVGTMAHQDGVEVVLDAAHHIRTVHGRDDVFVVLVGTGDMFDALQERHAELGLGDAVRFTGFISDDDMLGYLASADIGLAPDLDSPLNNISTMIKTMDYMAMGLPVVSFDLIESRVSADDAAIYVPEHSAAAFGDAMLELLDDPARRATMAESGQRRITGPLSWANSAKQLSAAYDRALGSS